MKIQIVSDLHLEFAENKGRFKVNKKADLLIIAGDLGCGHDRQLDFIKSVSSQVPTILILGNHDPMWSTLKETKEFWNNVDLKGFYFLDNQTIEINGIHFIGSTLWSDLNKDPVNSLYIMKNIADYKAIYKDEAHKSFVNISDLQDEFEKSLEFVNEELQKSYPRKVLITHHLPTYASVSEKYLTSRANAAFATDLTNMLLYSTGLELCAHGHTHETLNYKLGDLHVVCNPLGYPHENNQYTNNFLIEI